jgi:hypothetical protein
MMNMLTRQAETHKSKTELEEPCVLYMCVTSALPSSGMYLSLGVEACDEMRDSRGSVGLYSS